MRNQFIVFTSNSYKVMKHNGIQRHGFQNHLSLWDWQGRDVSTYYNFVFSYNQRCSFNGDKYFVEQNQAIVCNQVCFCFIKRGFHIHSLPITTSSFQIRKRHRDPNIFQSLFVFLGSKRYSYHSIIVIISLFPVFFLAIFSIVLSSNLFL